MSEPGEEKISREDFELLQQVNKEMKDYNPLRRREPPKISLFSGSNSKNETSYDLWRYEVRGLMSNTLYEPDSCNKVTCQLLIFQIVYRLLLISRCQ